MLHSGRILAVSFAPVKSIGYVASMKGVELHSLRGLHEHDGPLLLPRACSTVHAGTQARRQLEVGKKATLAELQFSCPSARSSHCFAEGDVRRHGAPKQTKDVEHMCHQLLVAVYS